MKTTKNLHPSKTMSCASLGRNCRSIFHRYSTSRVSVWRKFCRTMPRKTVTFSSNYYIFSYLLHILYSTCKSSACRCHLCKYWSFDRSTSFAAREVKTSQYSSKILEHESNCVPSQAHCLHRLGSFRMLWLQILTSWWSWILGLERSI